MFVEISLMQKFILFLGHPMYSISVVLTTLLIFSGIGSFTSAKLGGKIERTAAIAIAAIAAMTAFYLTALPGIFSAALGLPLPGRVALSVLLLAPTSFAMGMPFPAGIRKIGALRPEFVPWACGVNGGMSVLSSIVAVIIAMVVGFKGVMCASAAIYLLAAVSISTGSSSSASLHTPPSSVP